MLCDRCRRRINGGARRRGPVLEASLRERLAQVMCENCGGVLGIREAEGSIAEKLAQLARFGLNAGGKPLFRSVRWSSK
ncbi:MAG TPA: hypothetical protein VKZ58_04550 [Longimicrobiales bacterium]|nr:hypothetical protein [Longimicrobiales bacterium]